MCRQSQKFLRSKRRCWGLLSGSCLKHSALFISWKKVFHDVESTWCWCCVIRNVPLVFALSVLSSNCKNSPQFLLPGHRPPFPRLDINKINPCGVHPWLALLYVKSELQKINLQTIFFHLRPGLPAFLAAVSSMDTYKTEETTRSGSQHLLLRRN